MLKIKPRHTKECRGGKACGCPLHLSGTINGQRVRMALGTASMEVGRKVAQQVELELLTGKKAERLTVSQAIKTHASDLRRQGLKAVTLKKYGLIHRQITETFGSRLVDEITPEDVRQLTEAWTQGPRTQRAMLERLRTFWTFCVDQEWCDRNPARAIKGPKVEPTHPQPFTRDEVLRLLAACDEFGQDGWQRARMRALVILMRFTGLSIGDAVRLPKAAVQGNTIVTDRKKNGAAVRVPIENIVKAVLDSFPHSSTEFYFWTGLGDPDGAARTYARRLSRVFKLAGVKGSSKRFRQTIATEYAAVGIEHAQHALGHVKAG